MPSWKGYFVVLPQAVSVSGGNFSSLPDSHPARNSPPSRSVTTRAETPPLEKRSCIHNLGGQRCSFRKDSLSVLPAPATCSPVPHSLTRQKLREHDTHRQIAWSERCLVESSQIRDRRPRTPATRAPSVTVATGRRPCHCEAAPSSSRSGRSRPSARPSMANPQGPYLHCDLGGDHHVTAHHAALLH